MTGAGSKLQVFLSRHLALVLTGLFCLLAIFTVDDYGLSWDENVQRYTGIVNWNYIFSGDQSLLSYRDRDYGVAFELPLIGLEHLFGLKEMRQVFLMRHLVTHLFFLAGALCCFKLADLLYGNKLLAATGFLLFVLHPHMYAHSFFNSKDIPFMSMFMIDFYLAARAFKNKSTWNLLLLGLGLGLIVSMRIMGVLLLFSVLVFLLTDGLLERRLAAHLLKALLVLVPACIILYATWPFLWKDPLVNFHTAFFNMSKFRWTRTNLFRGEFVKATEIGWDYVPVWFFITTPLTYLTAGLAGTALALITGLKTFRSSIASLNGKFNFIFLICFIGPVLVVIALHSVLYDGWRQLFFIYASFVMLAMPALHWVLQRFPRKWLTVGLLLFFGFAVGFMVMNRSFQHLYFNILVANSPEPNHIRKNFEMDYWGTSYRKALEYITDHDKADTLKIYLENDRGINNLMILREDQWKRIQFVPQEDATYYVTDYRWHPQDYPYKEVYAVSVMNNTINSVFKLK